MSDARTPPSTAPDLDAIREAATEYKAANAALDALPIGSDKTDAKWDVYNAASVRCDDAFEAWETALLPFDADSEEDRAANLVLALLSALDEERRRRQELEAEMKLYEPLIRAYRNPTDDAPCEITWNEALDGA